MREARAVPHYMMLMRPPPRCCLAATSREDFSSWAFLNIPSIYFTTRTDERFLSNYLKSNFPQKLTLANI